MNKEQRTDYQSWEMWANWIGAGFLVVWLGSGITYGLWARESDTFMQVLGVLGSLVTFVSCMGIVFYTSFQRNLIEDLDRELESAKRALEEIRN